jgi:voltage-gated potassium channel
MPHPATEHGTHYIICGFGRVGRGVAAGLRHRNRAIVAIDRESSTFKGADGFHTITGDATDDAVLVSAGIAAAHGLVAGTSSDETNLAIALSARALNSTLLVVARANHPEAEAKLLRAGASRVVSPYAIGAHRMATQLISPGIVAFLDAVRDGDQVDLWIEEVTIAASSSVVGQSVGEVLPRTAGLPNLIALQRVTGGHLVASPAPGVRLAAGDTLIVVGSRGELQRLIARLTGQPSRPS